MKMYENVWRCMKMFENAWKCMEIYEKEKIRKWGGSKKHVSADITSIKSEAFLATCVGGYFGRPQGDVWKCIEKCETVWKWMKMYKHVWKCMNMQENIWKHIKNEMHENVWKCMKMYENL